MRVPTVQHVEMKTERFAMAYRLVLEFTPLSVRSLKIAHIRRVHNRDRSKAALSDGKQESSASAEAERSDV